MLSLSILTLVFASALAQSLNLPGNFSVVYPSDSSYSSLAKSFNQRFSYQPTAIVLPTSVQDVSEAIKAGAAANLTVVARSGGHSYIANGLGGKNGALVVDLSKLKEISINGTQATIQTGNRLGDIYLALDNAGRAIPAGSCPLVGIGGHSGYGGYGFSSRQWGLTLDNIVQIEGVLANGTIFTASKDQNQELFWGLRGAAGSFAVTTSIVMNTYEAPPSATIFNYQWTLDTNTASSAMIAFQKYVLTDSLPASIAPEVTLTKGANSGSVRFTVNGGYYGPASSFNSTIGPLLSQLPSNPTTKLSTGTWINSASVIANGQSLNTSQDPFNYDSFYAKSIMTPENTPVSDAAWTAFIQYLAGTGHDTDLAWFVQVESYGGKNSKINQVDVNSTAFAKRDALFTIQFYASSSNYSPPYPDEGFGFLDNMVDSILKNSPSDWNYGAYINYIDDKLVHQENWQQLYYGPHYNRLMSLKKQVDPNNVFHFPSSVQEGSPTSNNTANSNGVAVNAKSSGQKLADSMLVAFLCLVLGSLWSV